MSARWIRVPVETRDEVTAALVAGALAVSVGVAAFWLTRLLLARERLPGEEAGRPAPRPGHGAGGAP